MEVVALESKKGPDPDLHFYYAVSDEFECIPSLRVFAKLPNKTPLLAIVDIPKQVTYVSEAAEINESAVRDMVNAYRNGLLTGQQLSHVV